MQGLRVKPASESELAGETGACWGGSGLGWPRGRSPAPEFGSGMKITHGTHSEHEEMGKDWPQLERLDLVGLVFSIAHSRSRRIRRVRSRVRAAKYIQLMRQTRPPCPIFSGVGKGHFLNQCSL